MISRLAQQIRNTLANWGFAWAHSSNKPLAIFTHFLVSWFFLSLINVFALGALIAIFRVFASFLFLPVRLFRRVFTWRN